MFQKNAVAGRKEEMKVLERRFCYRANVPQGQKEAVKTVVSSGRFKDN